jgi:hypothetical protein
MKYLVPVAAVFGLAGNVQAYDSGMPAMLHAAEHGRFVVTLTGLAGLLPSLFRQRR